MNLRTIDLISIAVITIIVIISCIQWFNAYRLNQKISEARKNIDLIFDAEVSYFNNQIALGDKKTFLSVPPQPSEPSFYVKPGDFSHGDWEKLNAQIKNPVYYSYSVVAEGIGNDAKFTVTARGDLNGNGKFSRWDVVGRVGGRGQIIGKYQVFVLDENE